MKKLTALCLTFVLAFALSVPAFATSSDTVVNADIINFTPEEIAEQKAIDARLREEFSSAPETRGVVDRVIYNAPIVSHQQINTYYCGPASTQMVYEGITGDTSHNQQWFANQLGTTSAGTSSSQIATTLASLSGEDYSVANIKTSNQTEADLYNNIANSLRLGCAVVVNVKTVPGRYTSSSGHFMVVHGSFIDMAYPDSSVYFTYTDPHYNDNYYGTFTLSGASMYDAIDSNAGNYVRVA